MAKISSKIRKVVFEGAIEKLYGERLVSEKAAFEQNVSNITINMVKRTAKKNGVDYDLLTTAYKPYLNVKSNFHFYTNSGDFNEELKQIFYNENSHVLQFEGSQFELAYDYKEHHVYWARTNEAVPYAGGEVFSEAERKELISTYKRYADFMKEVIASACAIRDVINSASTTKQLIDTSPELGEFIPAVEGCVALVPVETVRKVSALFHKK